MKSVKGQIAVETLGNRVVTVFSLDQPEGRTARGEIRLTTSDDRQRQGLVRILLLREGSRLVLRELLLSTIPPAAAGEPNIDLVLKLQDEQRLLIEVVIDGKRHVQDQVDLKPYEEKSRKTWLAVILIALLLLGLGFFLFRVGIPAFNAAGVFTAVASRSETQPAAPGTPQAPAATAPPSSTAAPAPAAAPPTSTAGPPTSTAGPPTSTAGPPATAAPPAAAVAAQLIEEHIIVYFHPDRSDLTAQARERLETLLMKLRSQPGRKVRIEGHCALFGSEAGRDALSWERAESVARFLNEKGWKPPTPPEIRGLGGKHPVDTDPARQHLNRRVEITLH